MSFNINQSGFSASMSKTITLAPARVDVVWDGQSKAVFKIGLSCASTAATFQAAARDVNFVAESEELPLGAMYGSESIIPCTVVGTVATLQLPYVGYGAVVDGTIRGWKLTATEGGASRVLAFGRLTIPGLNVAKPQSESLNVVSGVTAVSCF